ncbi:MAG TPA: tRNA (adenosine(37)-N6)-threonylcarbamoyltransferase complex ATPase subunit type 1 TsaE [Candidatus Saccharimonadia bacterium]|nr:tRNA (adenosine(37)-N6)-threonylcarbamoyltransferase complex ATPase subunit type 1 TsaE [Candidatus Saccharimonadia bacterium]
MNSAMTYEISTTSSEATQVAARRLSQLLLGGETLELVSDLGGGKTTFVQGLAAGLGYKGLVTSPTFTLSNIYELPDGRELHHYDLYRLTEGGVLADELAEDLDDPKIITVIEWPGLAEHELPKDRLTLTLEVTGEDDRKLVFSAGGPESQRLLEELAA